MKLCPKCKVEKPIDAFNKNRSTKDGLQCWCRTCKAEDNRKNGRSAKAYRRLKAENPEKLKEAHRRAHLVKRYGITEDDYAAMTMMQGDRCFICEREVDYKLFVDHDHKTGEVRGLLCAICNGNLGWLEKNAERISWHLRITSPPAPVDGIAC